MPPKKKGRKKEDDYWDSEFQNDAELLATDAPPPTDDAPSATIATADDDQDDGGLMAQMKRPKKKTTKKAEEPVEETTVKSKKDKEREKKERQKEAKKQQAAQHKQEEEPVEVKEPESKKKGGKKAEPAPAAEPKGKKKAGAPIAALQKMLAAQKAAEEEAKRLEEEELKRIEEEEKRLAEEEQLKEEAKQRKKEKERLKREQLRKEGKLLSKSQKEAKQRAEQRKQALLAAGMIIAGLEDEKKEGEVKKKVVYSDKKKPKKKEVAPEPEQVKVEEEPKDSWDQSDDDGVKESWDQSSEEEEAEEIKVEDVSSESDSESESEDDRPTPGKKTDAAEKRDERIKQAMAARSKDNLRSPICVVLGHVDTGKTKLLDKIRQTNVQEGEAGGITQQIGATYFPLDIINKKTELLKKQNDNQDYDYKLPGLLVIDTPGHESFTNLRSRGSSLCNIAVLVVDIMHGLEPQTLESIRLLRDRKTPFIVALNKIDRIYGWDATPNNPFQDSLTKQNKQVRREFDERVKSTIVAFAEQGLNSVLYYDNKNFARNVSLVPTSAITGEGIPDLLHLLMHLTQTRMSDKLMYLSELEATVLEVKVVEGLGTTIDVILSNGVLREGDRIVLCGLNGPIATNIRALLTPQPLRELRVKSAYVHHKSIKAAMGVKISANDLEKAIAGSRLLVCGPDDDEDDLMDEVMEDLQTLQNFLDKSGRGVSVQASTLGSLEALLEFLRVSKIPVAAINIGPVYKKDVIRCGTMLERAKEYAVLLCFDVKVDRDAQELAEDIGIKVFKADIIYHLFDQFTAYNKEIVEQKRKDQAPQAVFPCILKIIPGAVFNKRDPIILGVDVMEGALRIGTPICVVNIDPETKKRDIISLGKVTGIEQNHKPLEIVKKGAAGGGVAVKIENPVYETPRLFGRHFTETNELYSKVTRQSIDVLKDSFRNDLSKDEWALIVKLKKTLDIQ